MAAGNPTQPDIAEVFEPAERLGPDAVGGHLKQLYLDGILTPSPGPRFQPQVGLVVGLSVGTVSLRGAIYDANGDEHCPKELPIDYGQLSHGVDYIVGRMRGLVIEILEAALHNEALTTIRRSHHVEIPDGAPIAGLDKDPRLKLLGLAVAWPSALDLDKRLRGASFRGSTWSKEDDAISAVANRFGPPFTPDRVHSVNDANAAALAYAFDYVRGDGESIDPQDSGGSWQGLMTLRVGGGVGTGMIRVPPTSDRRFAFIDAKFNEGTNGLAGEIGHSPVDMTKLAEVNADKDRPTELKKLELTRPTVKCSCGKTTHVESFTSWLALKDRFERSEITGYSLDSSLRARLQSAWELPVTHAQEDIGKILADALTSVILTLDPRQIILTGPLATQRVVDGIKQRKDNWERIFGTSVDVECIKDDHKNDFIGARGAALAAIRGIVYRQIDFLDSSGRFPNQAPIPFGPRELKAFANLSALKAWRKEEATSASGGG